MLVLTRKTQQQIQIGDKITITIVRVTGQSVRVGIQAPEEVRVVRGELLGTSKPAKTSHVKGPTAAPTADAGDASAGGAQASQPPALYSAPLASHCTHRLRATLDKSVEPAACTQDRRRVPGAASHL